MTTPYWVVMGARVVARQASAVEPTRVRDAEGGGWVQRSGPWGTAYLDEATARAVALAAARRDVECAEEELARARAELAALEAWGQPEAERPEPAPAAQTWCQICGVDTVPPAAYCPTCDAILACGGVE